MTSDTCTPVVSSPLPSRPAGWLRNHRRPAKGVRALLTNTDAQSLVQVDVDRPATATEEPLTLDDVDLRLSDAWLSSSWREYKQLGREQP